NLWSKTRSLSAQPYLLGMSTGKCLEDLEAGNESMSSVSRSNRGLQQVKDGKGMQTEF
ncbi:hypothetical protein L873DRAFT_1810579, partial [Choiromyces venosus 120613-1]